MNAGLQTIRTARELAYAVLVEQDETGAFAADLLDQHAENSAVSDADRRLAREITLGAIRRRGTLEALIRPHVRRPRENIEPGLWTLLEIGTYQLVFTAGVPSHAALNETVEVARRAGQPRWTGFLNGVLRSVARNLTDETGSQPAADAVPLSPGHYRVCRAAVFPNPDNRPLDYFAEAFSFPAWLVERWGARFSLGELIDLGFWFNAPPRLTLRVNPLRSSREALLEALRNAGVDAGPGHRPESIALGSSTRIDSLPGFREGWFSVQDESAMGAAALLAPRPGMQVLDLGAAPGTKTMHLAELMENRGRIAAVDVSAERLVRVAENAHRLGVDIVEAQAIRADASDFPRGPFDAILFDAPCSNTGVLGRRPEARWRIQPADIAELSQLQTRLLRLAVERLQPGGRLVYSTCSIEPEENQEVVAAVVRDVPGLSLITEQVHFPGRPADGAYQALLERAS